MPKITLALRSAAIIGLALTSACGQFQLPALPFGVSSPTQLTLLEGTVTVTGPNDYCVDQKSSRPTLGFAAIAPCVTLSNAAARPAILSFITLQVGAEGTGFGADLPELAQIIETSGAIQDAEELDARYSNSQNAVLAIYRSSKPSANVQARAFFDINGRSAAATVREIEGAPLSFDAATDLLMTTLARLRSANATLDTSSS